MENIIDAETITFDSAAEEDAYWDAMAARERYDEVLDLEPLEIA